MDSQPVASTEAEAPPVSLLSVVTNTTQTFLDNIQELFAGFIETADDDTDEPRYI